MEGQYLSERLTSLRYSKVVRAFLNVKSTARNNCYLVEGLYKLQSDKSKCGVKYPGIHSQLDLLATEKVLIV